MQEQGKAQITIEAVDKATRPFARIQATLQRLNNAIAPVSGAMMAVAGSAARVTGVLTAVGLAVGGLAHRAADAAGRINDLSSKYKINTQALQVWGTLAQDAGGSMEDMAQGYGKLTRAMNQAMAGTDQRAIAAFRAMGISVGDLRKMKPEEVMLKMADAFKAGTNDMGKQAILLELMGKNGQGMMDALEQGSSGYQERLREMVKDRTMLTEAELAQEGPQGKAWDRLMRKVSVATTRMGLSIGEKLLPHLPKILETIERVAVGVGKAAAAMIDGFDWLSEKVGQTGAVFTVLGVAFAPTIFRFGQLVYQVFKLGKTFYQFVAASGAIGKALGFVRFALMGIARIALMNPIGLLVTAVAVAGIYIYRNWDKIVQTFANAWGRIKEMFSTGFFNGLLQGLLEMLQYFANNFLATLQVIAKYAPDSLLPEAMRGEKFQNFRFDFADKRADEVRTADKRAEEVRAAANRSRAEVQGTLNIKVEGAKVQSVQKAPGSSVDYNVESRLGPAFATGS